MGIQVHRTLVLQHAHALGQLKKLARNNAPHDDILAQQRLVESLRQVIDHQGMDEVWDPEHAVEPRPHKRLLPRSAYTRDSLNIMRKAGRPLRVAEILDELCRMHQVSLSEANRRHACQKLAEANWRQVQRGIVERVDKDPTNAYGACLYALKEWARSPNTLKQ
jgi:hypothetical protein